MREKPSFKALTEHISYKVKRQMKNQVQWFSYPLNKTLEIRYMRTEET